MKSRISATVVVVCLVVLAASGCVRESEVAEPVEDAQLGLSKTSVFSTPEPIVATVDAGEPGENELLGSYFSGSPPMIPHQIEEYLPIRIGENVCLECHDLADMIGEELVSGDPTPMPASHYPGEDTTKETSGARFTCTQCHTAQTGAEPLVANTYSQ